jgi:iron complex transport system substrate-binding protein
MRIVSLLPSATEIVFDLGLGSALVGRSQECHWPESAKDIPVVSLSRIDSVHLTGGEIDRQVREAVVRGEALYAVDEELLHSLQPDVILTQDLCRVCAVSGNDLRDVGARVISLGPRTINEVAASIRHLGKIFAAEQRANEVADTMIGRIERVRQSVSGKARPRVFVAEWLEPPFACGHWIPEMVEAAGGLELMGRAGEKSFTTTWDEVRALSPELVIAAPCGFDEERATRDAEYLDVGCPVIAVDADRYFVRPSPSLADGVEQLAEIFHG